MIKKVLIVFLYFIVFFLFSCNKVSRNLEKDDLQWDNEDGVYVLIKKEFRKEIFINPEKSFLNYNYKKIYVINKKDCGNEDLFYRLLFIVDEKEIFISKLKEDDRIESFEFCKDLPFESFDNRFLESEKKVIHVKESTTIYISGECDIYWQHFYYDLIFIKPKKYDIKNNYGKNDFAEIKNIDYIEKKNDGLLIKLRFSNYYELIKNVDMLARNNKNQDVELVYIYVIHPIWEISNDECV